MGPDTRPPQVAPLKASALPPQESHPDAELVLAVLQRDRKATAEFVSLYSDAVYAYVRRRLHPRTDLVEDIVQEVFMAALGNLSGFAGHSSLRTWMLGIARHKVEDHYRDCLKHGGSLSDLEEHEDGPLHEPTEYEEIVDAAKRRERVLEILSKLPDAYRVVIMWRYWERRSAREMAVRSGKTEKSIERLLARARQEFRRRWNRE